MMVVVLSVKICLRDTTRGQLMAHSRCGESNRKSTILLCEWAYIQSPGALYTLTVSTLPNWDRVFYNGLCECDLFCRFPNYRVPSLS